MWAPWKKFLIAVGLRHEDEPQKVEPTNQSPPAVQVQGPSPQDVQAMIAQAVAAALRNQGGAVAAQPVGRAPLLSKYVDRDDLMKGIGNDYPGCVVLVGADGKGQVVHNGVEPTKTYYVVDGGISDVPGPVTQTAQTAPQAYVPTDPVAVEPGVWRYADGRYSVTGRLDGSDSNKYPDLTTARLVLIRDKNEAGWQARADAENLARTGQPIPRDIYTDRATCQALYYASLIPGCAGIAYQLVYGTDEDRGKAINLAGAGELGWMQGYTLDQYNGPYKAVIDGFVAAHSQKR